MPDEKRKRFEKEFGISEYNADLLTRNVELANYFEQAVKDGKKLSIDAKTIANFMINKKPNTEEILPAKLIEMIKEETTVEAFDKTQLKESIKTVLAKNPQAVADYKAGKVQIIGFLIGQIKQALPEAKDTEQIRNVLTEMLK